MNNIESLVAPSDIAEMTGVSRAAVSNWRKRFEDFPDAVGGTPAKPLFARDVVVTWLRARGHKIRQDSGQSRVWAAMNAVRGSLAIEETGPLLLTLACARKLALEDTSTSPLWERLLDGTSRDGLRALDREAQDLGKTDARWRQLVALTPHMLDMAPQAVHAALTSLDTVPAGALGDVADFVLAKISRASIRGGLEHGFVDSRTSTALASLAAAAGGNTLYDPACGIGSALIAAVAAGATPAELIGHEISSYAATQAAQRAFLRDIPARIITADVIATDPEPDLLADVIIAEPPFGLSLPESFNPTDRRWLYGLPVKSSSDLAWVQHVVAHLAPNGTGFVITPVGTLMRSGGERNARSELVRRGCVEAVISLPTKMLPHVGIGLAIWVLRTPQDDDRLDISFIDGRDTDNPEAQVGQWLTALRSGRGLDVPHERVDVRDVLAGASDLTPARWIQVPDREPSEVAAEYRDSWTKLTTALDHIKGSGSSLEHFAGVTDARLTTIGDLVDQGLLEVRQGRGGVSDLDEDLSALLVTPRMLRNGAIEPITREVAVPANLQQLLTQEQDVLVATQGGIAAALDDGGGHLPALSVYRIRVTNNDHLSPRYLALVLGGAWNSRFLLGGTIPRADLRLLEIPLVPLAQQYRVLLADTAVQVLAAEAQDLLTEAGKVRHSMLDALRYNVELPEVSE